MPTGTPDLKPFAARGTLTREQLLAYASGELPPAEHHAIETHLESDPLAQEASEGLAFPGALHGLRQLDAHRPSGGSQFPYLVVITGLVAIMVVGWLFYRPTSSDAPKSVANIQHPVTELAASGPVETALTTIEIEAATELPESLFIGHRPDDKHVFGVSYPAPVEREPGVERLAIRNSDQVSTPSNEPPRPVGRQRISRQLIYLHDLKLIHPKELYPTDVSVQLEDLHVEARHADRNERDPVQEVRRTMAYLPFMDAALAKYVRNDHKGCLEDMRFLLTQYPDDVNALFYGGLCAYNIGMYGRARTFLHRSATHAIDTFDEESIWYHALTLDRLGEHDGAREAFERIASSNGFYASRAREALTRR